MLRAALLSSSAIVVLGCGGGGGAAPRTIGNTGGGDGAAVVVDPAGPLGVLALPATPARLTDAPYWVAITPDAAAVVPAPGSVPAPLTPGTAYTALSARGGAPVQLTAGAATTVPYGCDDIPLDVIPLTGARVPPALTWILPSPLPAGWAPAALPLTVDVDRKERRRWKAGALELELSRDDKTHATLRIAAGGKELHRAEAEAYFMQGSDEIDLDFTQGRRPGIPFPEAVFAIAPAGPHLVVLDASGYEGVGFDVLLVTPDGTSHAIEAAGFSAYYCAF